MDQMICYNCFKELGSSTNFCRHCGYPVAQDWERYPHALPYGTVLGGRYITGRVLGQGGFGITYVAQDYRSKQLVAIKEFFPDTMAARGTGNSIVPFTGQRGEDFNYGKSTFLEEARTIAQFNDAPGIVHVYSYFEEYGTAYFAMEYIEGMSLQKYIERSGGRITWDEAKRILVPVMDALAKVHAKGIIHRDIKPDNIHITRTGEVKVLDFGSARYSMGEKSRSLDVVLTHGFAPREQYSRHGRQGAYTDVYALAATFYYSVTGKKPPDSIDRLDEDTLPLPSSLGAQIPTGEEDVIIKALSVEPQDRYQTMVDFKAALLNPPASSAYSAPQAPAFAPPAPSVQPQTPAYTAPQQPSAAPAYTTPQPSAAPAYTAPQQPGAAPAYTAPRQPQPAASSYTQQQSSRPAAPSYTAPQPSAPTYTPPQSYTAPKPQPGAAVSYTAPQGAAPAYAAQGQNYRAQQTSGAVPPGYNPAPAAQKKKKKWVLPTVIGIAAAAIVLVVALVVSGANKKPGSDTTAQTDPANGKPTEVIDTTDISSSGKTETTQDDEPHDAPKPKVNIKPAPSGGESTAKIYGFYAIKSLSMNGVTMDVEGMQSAEIDIENTYLLLNTDKTGEIALDGEVTPLTWSDNQTLDIDGLTCPFTISDGELSMTADTDDGKIGMVFTRRGDTKPETPNTDPSEEPDGKCGDNIYWSFEEDTLYLYGTGSTYDYSNTTDIPWFSIGVDIDFVVIGEGVTRIGDGAFYKCQMVSVELPTTLTTIGYLSFGFCPYLGSVEIPASVSYLGDGAFYGSDVESAYIYSKSLSMDIDVFAKCENLTEVYFYGSIVGLGLGAFEECTTTVYYPAGDPSWDSVAGNDYGGNLTWQKMGEATDTDWYSAELFSIGMPAAWSGKYTIVTDDDNEMLIVYHKESNDAGYGGLLYCFRLFESYDDYKDYPSWQYVGFISNGSRDYTLIAILPSDVQFPSELQEQYLYMFNALSKIKFAGENGYDYSAQ